MLRKENAMKQYDDNQYYEQGDAELGTGFTNYERLLLELNYKNYYPNKTTAEMTGNKDYEGLKGDRIRVYEKILNECGLDPEANYDKNTDHAYNLLMVEEPEKKQKKRKRKK